MIGRKAITGQTRSVKPQKQYKNHTIFGQTSHFKEAWETWYGKRSCDKKHTRKRVPRTYRTKKHKKITDSTSCDPAFRHFNLRQLSKTTYAVWNETERGQQSSIGFFRNPTCSCFVYLCIYSLVLRLQSLKSAWMFKKLILESGTGIWDGHDRALSHLMKRVTKYPEAFHNVEQFSQSVPLKNMHVTSNVLSVPDFRRSVRVTASSHGQFFFSILHRIIQRDWG